MFTEEKIKRAILDDFLVYSSPTLHHTRYKVQGFMYKEPSKKSLFSFTTQEFYKRYFTISTIWNYMEIKENANAQKVDRVMTNEIISIQNIKNLGEDKNAKSPQWKFYFEIKTKSRDYKLFCPTKEERDLWISSFNRIMNIPIADTSFKLIGDVSLQQ